MPRLRKPKAEVEDKPQEQQEEVVAAIEATPDEPIEIEFEDEDDREIGNGSLALETKATVVPPPPKEDDSEALRKRIAELEAAERGRADTDRQLAEERRRRQESESEVARVRSEALQDREDSLTNALGAAQAEIDAAQRDLETALANQDAKLQAEATSRISKFSSRLDRLEAEKAEFEVRKSAPRQQQPTNQFEAAIAGAPEWAKDWYRAHPVYVTDPEKAAHLGYLNLKVQREGKVAGSASYIQAIEEELGLREKPKPVVEPRQEYRQEQERGTIVAAPPSRTNPTISGSPSTTKVTLRPDEREIAYSTRPDPAMSRADAEKLYAKNKLRLIELKRQGHYQ